MTNPTAVITGAASGIGLALATDCVSQGMCVIMVDRNEAVLMQQADTLRTLYSVPIHTQVCDVSSEEQMLQLANTVFSTFNRVDLLINNAGISGSIAPLWEMSTPEIRQVMDVNVYGIVHGIKAFLPFWFERNQPGHIVNMASVYGLCSGSQLAAYTMSKHAVVALSESLYFDLRCLKRPIHVSVVCPTLTNTNLLSNSLTDESSLFHALLNRSLQDAQSSQDVAAVIMQGIADKLFYIFPDAKVKRYCEEYQNALMEQSAPHEHELEKLFQSLSRHAAKRECRLKVD